MTTATITWPTAADLASVSKSVSAAQASLDDIDGVGLRLSFTPELVDDPTTRPTFEELGRLSAFLDAVDQDIELMSNSAKWLRAACSEAGMRMNDDAR